MRNLYASRNGNSFDDSDETAKFKELFEKDDEMRNYISQFINSDSNIGVECRNHPNGARGIDLTINNAETGEILINIDVEKWSNFYLDPFTVFDRKDYFLKDPVPFLLVCFSPTLHKWLAVDSKIMLKYPYNSALKTFTGKNAFGPFTSSGRKIPRSDAYISA